MPNGELGELKGRLDTVEKYLGSDRKEQKEINTKIFQHLECISQMQTTILTRSENCPALFKEISAESHGAVEAAKEVKSDLGMHVRDHKTEDAFISGKINAIKTIQDECIKNKQIQNERSWYQRTEIKTGLIILTTGIVFSVLQFLFKLLWESFHK